jgi:protein-tyrosine phosphatase
VLDNDHIQLLPSDDVKAELSALEKEEPKIREFAERRATGPRAENIVSIYAVKNPGQEVAVRYELLHGSGQPGDAHQTGEIAFQMVWIPVPERSGVIAVSRMPGYGTGASVQKELDALLGAGFRHIVGLVPRLDLADFYRNPDYLLEAGKRFGEGLRILDVVDYAAPGDDALFEQSIEYVEAALQRGEKVFVHCGMGCGRAGVFASCVLVRAGMQPFEAIETFRAIRGCGPETTEQVAYVVRFARRLGKARSGHSLLDGAVV